jgi:hypothetical protein
MEIGAAYAAGAHPDEHPAFAGRRGGNIRNDKGRSRLHEDCGFHGISLAALLYNIAFGNGRIAKAGMNRSVPDLY